MAHLQRVGASFLALGMVTSVAVAEGPVISMALVADGHSTMMSLDGFATGSANVFNYHGIATSANADWFAAWNFNASDAGTSDGLDRVYTAGNFVVTNTSASTMVFDLVLSMPISLVGSGLFTGSVSAGLTTEGAGSFGTVGDAPIWTASSGGTTIATLLRGPISTERTTAGSSILGTDAFGDPVPSGDAFGITDDLSVRLQFTLSGGASASFTSVLVGTVPAPGAAALLGLGGLLMNSRRRRG